MKITHPTVDDTLLLVVDIQGKLARLMHDSERMIAQCRILIQACRKLPIPIVWAEQLPDKLGPTVPELAEVLDGVECRSKSSFGCCGDPELMAAIEQSGRRHILLCGIETHVCVWQTAAALCNRGYPVHLIADAVSSRSVFNRDIAFRRMETASVHLSNVEMILFELMVNANHAKFRDITGLLK